VRVCERQLTVLVVWCIHVQRLAQFVREVDPDIITGYNIQNFDLSYLLGRAKHLRVDDFCYLGRVKNIQSVVRSTTLQSKQLGKRENKTINIDGRVQFDLLLVGNVALGIRQLLREVRTAVILPCGLFLCTVAISLVSHHCIVSLAFFTLRYYHTQFC